MFDGSQSGFDGALLRGKVALITMSTFGIGRETARQMAAAGAEAIVLNGRDAERGEAFADEMRAAAPGTQFLFVAGDITNPDQLENLFRRAATEFGGLDILVHSCTQPFIPAMFLDTPQSDYPPLVEGLFLSLVRSCQYAVPMMLARGGGSIVAISSDAARVPTPTETVMGGLFAASVQFARTLAVEMAPQQIRANVIAPSVVRDTRGWDKIMGSDATRPIFQQFAARAAKRLGVPGPENLAPLAVFLASPLSSHMTGQVITVNGGLSG